MGDFQFQYFIGDFIQVFMICCQKLIRCFQISSKSKNTNHFYKYFGIINPHIIYEIKYLIQ